MNKKDDIDKYKKCVDHMKHIHSLCNFPKYKCDILFENLMLFCDRYNSDSNKANCTSVSSLGATTLNLITKSPN